ncbi:hypothetical protein F2P56_015262 [Juglans regia]|uniref:Uncharacterized protein LOC108981362 n=2 Tax=Juglans regia TaxID=51240 RepID=A0A2I4DLJ6_JUGRE|nr:uncharacterized protein LOC108981362 [Juglans regia]KAF5465237.1 hypothetical protein F2P56_015262 [Juglans regia]
MPPRILEGADVLAQLQMLGDVQFGKSGRKRKRTAEELNWTKYSIFFKLPYWVTLCLRHNLDVMHIEKNICDNILCTLMNIPGKTKDNIDSRRDLEIFQFRKELHLKVQGTDIALALTELSTFFKELCARTLDVNHLSQLQIDIVTILCKLEMIFPPSFFDVMVHLAVHLPREAILRGPVQYRWMYPFERYLDKFKRYVKNKARPEGSIAEAYIHIECVTFCSMYLQDIETKFTRMDRNIDGSRFSARKEHYEKCKVHSPMSINRTHQTEFPTWFRKRVQDQRITNPLDVTADLYALVCGPEPKVASYAACIINGKRFHTKQRELQRHTQNSGVLVTGDESTNNVDFYGVINDIVELRYMGWHRVYLFMCDWFDVGDPRRGIRVDNHMTSINMDRTWYKDEPFVLACQASQCFYIRDIRVKGRWFVVQKYTNRDVYDIPSVPRVLEDIDGESSDDDAYQENESSYDYAPLHCDGCLVSTPLNRNDIEPGLIDAREVTGLVGQNMDSTDFIDDGLIASSSGDAYGDGKYSDEDDLPTDDEFVSE